MDKRENNLNEIEALKAELIEKKRIEDFLRSENKNLWTYINNIQKLPFFNVFILFSQKVKKIISTLRIVKENEMPTVNKNNTNGKSFPIGFGTTQKHLQVLFVIPNNKIEIGGIQTSVKLAEDLRFSGINVKIVSIVEDPSAVNNDLFLNKEGLNEIQSINILIVCGAESVNLSNELYKKFNSKRILLMQGPDHYFTPDWENSKNFVSAIRNFELVVTISNFLNDLAKQIGAKNTKCVLLGFDDNIFKFNESNRVRQIVIPCRSNIEKGLKILLPQIPELRKKGWRVVGFGDLENPKTAEVFDKFYGRIDKLKIYEIFIESKILLDPSFIEGLGLIPLEAAASGVVPIISKRHSYDGLFNNGLIPFIEIDDFQIPEKVLSAIEKAEKLNPEKISKTVQDLNWAKGSSNFVKVINQLLTNSLEI